MNQMAEAIRNDDAFFFYRGRVALYAILKAMDVIPGDEIILQAFTCLAVPNPIVSIGAKPVYVDIDPHTFNMNPSQLEDKITGKTKAILVQHTFGIPADMDPIMEIARKHNLYVIEDCCHTLGSRYAGREVGTFGDAAFHSYEWGKPVIIGLGGTAVVNDPGVKANMREVYRTFVAPRSSELAMLNLQYIAHSLLLSPSLYWFAKDMYRRLSRMGILVGNFRSEEMQGKISPDYNKRMFDVYKTRLLKKLANIDQMIAHRRWVASRYNELFIQHGFQNRGLDRCYEPIYSKFPLLFNDKSAILEQARENRIELYDMFATPIHPLHEAEWSLVGYGKGMCPVAEEISGKVISLPIHSKVDEKTIARTIRFLSGVGNYAWA